MDRKTWAEFRAAGMLWWINRILHTLGWSIVVQLEDDGTLEDVYPARTGWFGFADSVNSEQLDGFRQHIRGDDGEGS